MLEIVPWFIQRASEPSTWAGLAGLAVVFGVTTEQWSMIGNAVAAVSAAIAMFVSEAKELAIGHRCRQPSVQFVDGPVP